MARSRPQPGHEPLTASDIGERFPGLPPLVRDWLSGQPGIARFLSGLEQRLRDGSLSHEDVIRLAKRWSDTLPPRRGVLVYLHDIAQQPELPIDLPEPRRPARWRGRGRTRPK